MSATTTRLGRGPVIRVSARRVSFSLVVHDDGVCSDPVSGPAECVRIARAAIGAEISECVLAMFLDARQRVTGYTEVARGTLNAAHFRPRDILSRALIANAAGIVVASVAVAHNHPSGLAHASRADRAATAALRNACALVGVPLTDHIIVTATDYVSLREDERWEDAERAGASR